MFTIQLVFLCATMVAITVGVGELAYARRQLLALARNSEVHDALATMIAKHMWREAALRLLVYLLLLLTVLAGLAFPHVVESTVIHDRPVLDAFVRLCAASIPIVLASGSVLNSYDRRRMEDEINARIIREQVSLGVRKHLEELKTKVVV